MVWMRELGLQGDVISQHGGGWMKIGIWPPHFGLRGVFFFFLPTIPCCSEPYFKLTHLFFVVVVVVTKPKAV